MPDWLETIIRDPEWEGLLRVLIAGVVAVLVGIEREREGKPAGARTYGLVAMGSAIFTVVGIYGFGEGDPGSRIAAQIVTGIGFIGAGTILHMRRRVVGLTTAAGLWVSAAIGMAIGAGLLILGIGAGIFMFFLLQFVRPEWLITLGLASAEDVEGVTRHEGTGEGAQEDESGKGSDGS
jgi:putative Mg2+ transporter-C (MgtC) family protein